MKLRGTRVLHIVSSDPEATHVIHARCGPHTLELLLTEVINTFVGIEDSLKIAEDLAFKFRNKKFARKEVQAISTRRRYDTTSAAQEFQLKKMVWWISGPTTSEPTPQLGRSHARAPFG